MPLNDMQIRRAKPETKAYTLGDGQGLSLLIEPNGSKSWRFRYRFAGKPKMISLGVYPTITLADARSRRDDARKLVAEGKNPSEVRKEQKIALQTESESAFEKIATEWHQMKSAKWSEGYASDIMEAFQNDIFPYVGTRPVGEIKPLELLNVLRKIEKRGALEKMRKVRQRCSEVFRYAIATGRAEYNPAADLSSALEVHQSNHFPFLKADEIPEFLRALDSYSGSRLVQIATKLLMITGVRTIELRAASWSEFDLDNAIWEIPVERMKMRKPHLVPLSLQALDLLHELKKMTGHYRYVFPGRNDPNKPMSEASINQVIKRIGYGGRLTGHGFRHTMSTILHEEGFNSAWIEIQLAHVDKNTIRGTYNHAVYLSMRKDMLAWYSDYIFNT
ncbi:tyrosine-type recombinase/integrase [Enterobacter hormaechei]|uniref:tyrosine-type recombinase/integrase n=1 Tax=Enterobacter cloacae complex TaxID=354276 RepID=UPI000F848C3C|nr:tyrosine-type recombinase/integrase [Enterobacter hormaechei]HAS0786580.1 tyrosine-type recombinase/integrase [Enterobacter hormaechei subsp. xiangfangensis]MCE1326946.1 tyrosine-type recombinase/integrase [Enterobacter hormaechei]MCM7677315.1 tyrosine-type recombinase/integrase [Enterobacter hormaechei]MCM8169922.1 tyrosine-type recombinase/integrase [Enterobacter hormaechei]MDV5364522.1 tyrosine-type recombinase/integrase [Enterobacter hormaechei]